MAAAGCEAAEAKPPIYVPGAANKALAALSKLIPDDWVATSRDGSANLKF